MRPTLLSKLATHRVATMLVLLLIYVVSLTAGMYAMIGNSVYWQQKQYLTHVEELAEDYIAGLQPTKDIQSLNVGITIYGKDGHRFFSVKPSNTLEGLDITQRTDRYVDPVLSGKTLFRLSFLSGSGSLIPSVLTVYGKPIIHQNTVVGAIFVVNVLPELAGALLGFLCFYTALYWIAAGCVMITSDRIRRTDETRQVYIANITHSLKAPIASVKAVTETLSDIQTLDEDRRMSYYGIILSEMNSLNHLVFQMLELSKLQSGEFHSVKRKTCFEDVFGPTIEKYKSLCECTQITLDISEDLYQLPPLYTDAEAAGMVLEILLENAVKYTHPGDTIRISSTATKRRITLCVWDNGGNIAEQDIPHIFERFYKGKNSSFSSSGLGLAIARETIEALNEKIWVKCVQPNETMFFFTITVA